MKNVTKISRLMVMLLVSSFVFLTQANAQTTFLDEGFEGGSLPAGWTQEYVSGTTDWTVEQGGNYGNPSGAHSGTYNARFYSSGAETVLVTPAMDISSATNLQLVFWLAMDDWAGDQDNLEVYYKTSAAGAWTLLQAYTTEIANWTEMTIQLPADISNEYYIGFKGIADYGYGVCIDDVLLTGDQGGSGGSGMVEVGTGTSTMNRFPAYGYYDYTWAEVIYKAEEIGLNEMVKITKVGFNVSSCSGAPYDMVNQKLYFNHTDLAQYPDANYSDPTNNGYSLVWEGNVTWLADGWHEFELTSPFLYNAEQNLTMLWENWDGSGMSSYPYWYYTSNTYMIKYKYQHGSFPAVSGYRSSYRTNARIYYENLADGTVNGTVIDAVTNQPVAGATVMAENGDYGVTLGDGTYSFVTLEGEHDITVSKAGYATQTMEGVIVPGDGVVTVDFTIIEDAVPPSGVVATLRTTDADVIDIDWGVPNSSYEIIYDDGTYENITSWLEEGSLNALKFTPVGYPCAIEGGSINIGDGTYPPGGDILQEFGVAVFDDDGANGMPGTLLGSKTVTPIAPGWVVFDLADLGININDGDFYIAMQQGGNYPDCAPIAIDETNPVNRSYAKYAGGTWVPAGYNDFMIRAVVSGPGGAGGVLAANDGEYIEAVKPDENSVSLADPSSNGGYVGEAIYAPRDGSAPRNLSHYEVYRVNEGDEFTPANWTLLSGYVTTNHYTDNQWESLPDGGYRWAVTAVYSGVTSEAGISNMLGKNWTSQLTYNITLSSGLSPEGALVTLVNHDGLPEHMYQATAPANGVVVFPEIWNGTYDMEVFLFGYDLWSLANEDVMGDAVYDIELQETTNPPRALYVDPLTLIATWIEPGTFSGLDENFDAGIPADWTIVNGGTCGETWRGMASHNGSTLDGTPFAEVDSDAAGSGCGDMNEELITPEFNGLGVSTIILEFDQYYNNLGDVADIDVWNGSQWVTVLHMTSDFGGWSNPNHQVIDITAHANAAMKVRFHYYDANWAWYWAVDNVKIWDGVGDTRGVLGYNVYLGDAQAGFTTATEFQYDPSTINWGQTYISAVNAVYESGVSDKIFYTWTSIYLPPPTNLQGEDAGHTAYLTWDPPSLRSAEDAGLQVNDVKITGPSPLGESHNGAASTATESRDLWDVQFNYDLESITGALGNAGAESDGIYFYTTRWATNLIHKISLDGTLVEEFSISGVSGLRDLAFDGTYFYGGAAGNTIYQMDFTNKTLVSTISSGTAVRSIAYDEGNDAFWVNNWEATMGLISRTGATLNTMAAPASMYGSAYDGITEGGPFLWCFTGTVTGGGSQVEQMDLTMGTPTGEMHTVDPAGIAGGLFTQIGIVSGKMTLGALAQGTPDKLIGYDLGDASFAPDNLIAYNIYRDGNMVGSTDAETTEYYDGGLLAGYYSYTVTAEYGDPTPGESMHEGPIEVYINGEGILTGTVTEYGTSPVPIVGATVTAIGDMGEYSTVTGPGGVYTLTDVTEGTYTMTASADGYQDMMVEDVFVGDEQTVTVDFTLLEFPYPVLGVYAERNDEQTEVAVSWYEPSDFYQILYDDGVADNVTAWDAAGNMNAVKFTPAGYPAEIFAAEVNIYNGSWPPGNSLTPFQVAIYDATGENGMPGNELGIIDVDPFDYGWVYVDFSMAGVVVPEGDFYVVMIQGGEYPDCAPIAIDETAPVYRSYSRYVTGEQPWKVADFADFMMRTYVYSPTDGSQVLNYNNEIEVTSTTGKALSMNPANVEEGTYDVGFGRFIAKESNNTINTRELENYDVYRLLEGDETEPDLWTMLGNTTETDYLDTDWAGLDQGWYRYAVVSKYTYNQSEAAFSNVLPNGFEHTVTINIRCNNGDSPEGAEVVFANLNGDPQYTFTATAPENGVVEFYKEVWEGAYRLTVELPYFAFYELQPVNVYGNVTLNVTLQEQLLPPQNFFVDNMTGVATWLPPVLDYYTVFEEGFEDGFIPAGWTQEYLTETVAWTVQTGCPSGTPENAHTGEYNASFVGSSAATRLVTPAIDLGGEILPKLIFWHTQPMGGGQDELKVYFRTSSSAVWRPLASYIDDIDIWTKRTLNLPTPTATYQIGFLGDAPEPAGLGISLDDVQVIAGIDPIGTDEARVLEGYNVYLDGTHMAFTTELTYTYTDLVIAQQYVAGVDAQYSSGNSIIVEFPFTYYTCEYFNPPTDFQGTVNGMNVLLTWGPPAGIEPDEYDIIYDDGTPENAFAWNVVGSEAGERFTPAGYPVDILSMRLHIYDGSWPAGNILSPLQILVYAADGANGFPGTELGMVEITPENYNWVDVDLSALGISVSGGDFYIIHKQIGTYPDCAGTAIDETAPVGRSYSRVAGESWVVENDYKELMIRAHVYGPYYGDQILDNRTVRYDLAAANENAVSVKAPALTEGEFTVGSGKYVYDGGRERFQLEGYNVWKDGEVINDQVLTANQYMDVCSPGGIYYYNVTAVYDMGQSCPIDPPFEAIVGADLNPPTDLGAEVLEGNDVLLTWNAPGASTGSWIHWDDGVNNDGIGLTSGGSFLVASRWDSESLLPYDGLYMTKMSFFPRSATTGYALKVWTGANAANLVLEMPLSGLIIEDWNTIILDSPVLVDASTELWFGYECIDQPEGEYPAGCDAGPAVAGYGDMISMDGATWDPLSGFGLDYNWNIQAYVTDNVTDAIPLEPIAQSTIENSGDVMPEAGMLKAVDNSIFSDNSRQLLLGYNVWKNGENIQYVPDPDTFYTDPMVAPGTYDYYVSAVYDEGESFWDGPATVTIVAKGDIDGMVYNALTMDPVAGAEVTVNPGAYTTTTDDQGRYMIMDVPAGMVDVTVTAAGFNPATIYNVEILNNDVVTVDVALYDETAVQPIPFYEPWDAASFDDQFWSFDPEIGNWQINDAAGNPAPTAEFNWNPSVTEYSYALVSVGLDATTATENVTLMFDLYLSDYANSGAEFLTVEVWDGEAWMMVDEFANLADIEWTTYTYDITDYAMGVITKVRFVAHGADSYDINYWYVDNIYVKEVVTATLEGTVTDLATSDPIEGASVVVEGYPAVTTDATGFYTVDVERGTYNVTASAPGYVTSVAEDVFISDVTTLDFALEGEPCDPPTNLTAEVTNTYDVTLNWDSPSGGGTAEWIHYDDGINNDGIGLTEGGTFMVAIRFEPSQLEPYAGTMLSQIKMFPRGFSTGYKLMVWTGANAGTLVLEQPLSGLAIEDWNTVDLDTPVPVDATQELWFGYECTDQPAGDYPAGCDAGPAVAGYGDMISMDGITWDPLSGYGLDYNWNIQGYVVSLDGALAPLAALPQNTIENSSKSAPVEGKLHAAANAATVSVSDRALLGFNVYRDGEVINDDLVVATTYTDEALTPGPCYNYYVTAVYTNCESVPSNDVDVCDVNVGELFGDQISLYPNPASTLVNIEMTDDVRTIRVLNYVGQVVYSQNVTGQEVMEMNVSNYSAGTYMIEFTAEDGTIVSKRLVVTK